MCFVHNQCVVIIMSKEKFYITTAIAYASRIPHIGNTYEAVLADAIARFKRMQGFDVFFLTGTDEHGQKIQNQAQKENIEPQAHVDKIAAEIKDIWSMMNISHDYFIRTTDKKHVTTVQKIFKKLYDNGDIYKSNYTGLYCTSCEAYISETLSDNGICPDCDSTLIKTSEEAYFFRLSTYTDKLIQHINDNPDFIQPVSRKNEMVNNFLNAGLTDLCVSRTSFNWGVPVTFDDKHIIYVWIDALSNYITALDFDPDGESGELYKKYWPCDVHLIGKDILRFHTIYWPIMLLALDQPLPKKIFGHPWMLVGNDKMSKTKGNDIYAKDLVNYFGVDAVRYYCLHEMPFASDGTITYELFIERYNSDLANILGNLVNRSLAMVHKYFDGIVPDNNCPEDLDNEIITMSNELLGIVSEKVNKLMESSAIDDIFNLLRRLNKYIDETTPWILAKDEKNKDRLGTVLYNLLEGIRVNAVLLSAFLPETAENILNQLNTNERALSSINNFAGMKSGDTINAPSPLFSRIDVQKKLQEIKGDAV